MAGGGGSLGVERSKRGKASKRKKKKRVGFTLDMTPLVDITFLLLTFFMFTTTMAAPQVMEMSIPPEIDKEVKVKENQLLSLFVYHKLNIKTNKYEDKLYWKIGGEDKPLEPIKLKEVKELSFNENTASRLKEEPNSLIFALKVDKESNYGLVVKILDELNLAEAMIMQEFAERIDPKTQKPLKRERRFTIANITDKEREELEALGGLE